MILVSVIGERSYTSSNTLPALSMLPSKLHQPRALIETSNIIATRPGGTITHLGNQGADIYAYGKTVLYPGAAWDKRTPLCPLQRPSCLLSPTHVKRTSGPHTLLKNFGESTWNQPISRLIKRDYSTKSKILDTTQKQNT